jgi:phosphatidylinositol alpha-1,6-mannosyltransferase
MRHLLVSNDFPPKVGGIQAYLWELWRRLPPEETFVYTTPYRGAAAFDAAQPFWIRRSREPVFLPNPVLAHRVNRVASSLDIDLVILDPGIPLGLIAGSLDTPYAIVAHGAEVTVPGRLPLTGHALGRTLRGARLVIAAGRYPAVEAERCARRPLPTVVIPPGVDTDRFVPLTAAARLAARARFGLEDEDLVVVSVSRLVPRKGMDTLIRAAARLRPRFPALRVVIAGRGRDRDRLGRLVAATGAPAEFVGFVDEADKPALLGCADVFAMLCRNRWAGLEQEGYGIVFAEAAACGVAQLCGRSGGSDEAVGHEETGLVVERPASVDDAVSALGRLLADADLRARLGAAARTRAVTELTYDGLARRLRHSLAEATSPGPSGLLGTGTT